MHEEKIDFKKLKEQHIPIINEIIKIMNDMALAVPKKYNENNMYPFRELCLGYLLICKNNVEAAFRLLENSLIHQINYINRNMFEMVMTLYYIDDDSHKKEERVTRYFEYNGAVINNKVRNVLLKYQGLYKKELPQKIHKELDQKYKHFVDKYKKQDGKKYNERTWSGLNLFSMLEGLSNHETKEKLLKHYQIVISMNNDFLHPTIAHIRSAVSDFYSGKANHSVGLLHMRTVIHLAGFIVEKFLSQFQKGRPALRARIDEVSRKLIEIDTTHGML